MEERPLRTLSPGIPPSEAVLFSSTLVAAGTSEDAPWDRSTTLGMLGALKLPTGKLGSTSPPAGEPTPLHEF